MHRQSSAKNCIVSTVLILFIWPFLLTSVAGKHVPKVSGDLAHGTGSSAQFSGLVAAINSDAEISLGVSLVQKKELPFVGYHSSAEHPSKGPEGSSVRTLVSSQNASFHEALHASDGSPGGAAQTTDRLSNTASGAHGALDEDAKRRLINHHVMNAVKWSKAYMQKYGLHKGGDTQAFEFSFMDYVIISTGQFICTTSNDILVMMPIFLEKDKVRMAGMYMVFKVLMTCFVAMITHPWRIADHGSYHLTAMFLSIALPALVSLKLFLEWLDEAFEIDEVDDDQARSGGLSGHTSGNTRDSQNSGASDSKGFVRLCFRRMLSIFAGIIPSQSQRVRYWLLAQLCIATNFDRFGMFGNLLDLKMTHTELFLGHVIASLVIALSLLALSQLWLIKFSFARIPPWFMLLLITMYALTSQVYIALVRYGW